MRPETPPEQQGVSNHHVLANKSFVWFYYVLKRKSLLFSKCREFPLAFISSKTTCCLSSFFLTENNYLMAQNKNTLKQKARDSNPRQLSIKTSLW